MSVIVKLALKAGSSKQGKTRRALVGDRKDATTCLQNKERIATIRQFCCTEIFNRGFDFTFIKPRTQFLDNHTNNIYVSETIHCFENMRFHRL